MGTVVGRTVVGENYVVSLRVSQRDQTTTITFSIFGHLQQLTIGQSGFKMLPNTKKTVNKLPKSFNFFAKLAKYRQIWSHWSQ